MDIVTTLTEECTTISLAGRFDSGTRQDFLAAVGQAMERSAPEIRIDFENVDYVDSSALGCFLMVREDAKKSKKTITLANARGTVRVVLDIANFHQIFRML